MDLPEVIKFFSDLSNQLSQGEEAKARPTFDEVDAMLCVWEDILDTIRSDNVSEWHESVRARFRDIGASEMRRFAMKLGKLCEAAWVSLTDEEQEVCAPFDWEFVPTFLRVLDFDNPEEDARSLALKAFIRLDNSAGYFKSEGFVILEMGGKTAWSKLLDDGRHMLITNATRNSHLRDSGDWVTCVRGPDGQEVISSHHFSYQAVEAA